MEVLQDLFLNLFSEGIGIIVTVLLIDRIIKNREEKRWSPTKKFVKANLFELTVDFIEKAFGYRFQLSESKQNFYWSFGGREIKSKSYKNLEFYKVVSAVGKYYENEKIDKFNFRFEIVQRTHRKLSNFFDSAAFLIEPELLSLILEFESKLERLIDSYQFYSEREEDLTERLEVVIISSLKAAISVHSYLETKVDKTITESEKVEEDNRFMKIMKETMEKNKGFLDENKHIPEDDKNAELNKSISKE